MFDSTFIDQLKRTGGIQQIAANYIQLKKKGKDYWANCPFHHEKSPSFKVDTRGFFMCHGCGKKGDMFNFVMEIEGVNFPESVKRVADMFNVPIVESEEEKIKFETRRKLKIKVLRINKHAVDFWKSWMQRDFQKSTLAKDYLTSRGINQELVESMNIGFAADNWNLLSNYLLDKGYSNQDIVDAGLAKFKDNSQEIYDIFRNRIIFPINDFRGDPIAFNGRSIDKETMPKYLNSPETCLYIKGDHLYGIDEAKNFIRDSDYAILTEGTIDRITLSINGVKNVVANLGTSLTSTQCKLLKRWTSKVLICYDGDFAGQLSTSKAIGTLLENDFTVKTLEIPNNSDPDEYVRKFGITQFNSLRKQTKPFIEHLHKQSKFTNIEEKIEALNSVINVLKKIKNPMIRRDNFDQTVQYFGINNSLINNLWKKCSADNNSEIKIEYLSTIKPTDAELFLIEILAADLDLLNSVTSLLKTLNIEDLATRDFLQLMIEYTTLSDNEYVERLNLLIDDNKLSKEVIEILQGENKKFDILSNDEKAAQVKSCIQCITKLNFDKQMVKISKEINEAEKLGDWKKLDYLINKSTEVCQQSAII